MEFNEEWRDLSKQLEPARCASCGNTIDWVQLPPGRPDTKGLHPLFRAAMENQRLASGWMHTRVYIAPPSPFGEHTPPVMEQHLDLDATHPAAPHDGRSGGFHAWLKDYARAKTRDEFKKIIKGNTFDE